MTLSREELTPETCSDPGKEKTRLNDCDPLVFSEATFSPSSSVCLSISDCPRDPKFQPELT